MAVMLELFSVSDYHSPSLSPPYNCIALQANGLDERYNQTLQKVIPYFHQKKEVWDDFLDTCVYAYNTSVHETTAYTPFELMFGRRAVLPIDLEIDKCDPENIIKQQEQYNPEANASITAVEQIMQHRQQLLEAAKANIKKQQEKQKELYDRKHARPNAFVVGQKVLKKDFTRKKRRGGKMDHRYQGPFVITQNLGKGLYRLQGVEDPGIVTTRVSGAHLKPYKYPDEEHVSVANEICFLVLQLFWYVYARFMPITGQWC